MKQIAVSREQKDEYLIAFLSIAAVSVLCAIIRNYFDYKVTGYLLLVTVSILATFLRIAPVLFAAVLSALIFNFFFIPPFYTFHISTAGDALLFLMFFLIALINAVLTHKIRRAEKAAQIRETKWSTMKLYNALLDSLSHELRTPISLITGGIGTLQEKHQTLSENNRVKLLAEMEKASFRLNYQVENLLNMSRIESGFIQPKYDWCDVSELLYNVLSSLKEELEHHVVTVNVAENLPLFKLDYGLTEHILYNLIHNAANYSGTNENITVEIYFSPEVDYEFHEGNPFTLKITISDNGPGFPANEIDKVFEKFYRLKHSKTGGTGLGLSIVKGFVESQNGKVILENKVNGGSEFTLLFPCENMQIKNIGND